MNEQFAYDPGAALAMVERERVARGCTCKRNPKTGNIPRFDEQCPAMDYHVGCCRPRTDLHATTDTPEETS